MAEFVLKYADGRGQIHQQVASASSEKELRDRYSQQGFLIYSVNPRVTALVGSGPRRKKVNLEKFLIFNQQFVTLIRAGLPILKSLDLLADRLTDPKLGPHIQAVRDEVRNGALLSDAFRQQGVFPRIYATSVLAGEKSGSLTEVLDRYIGYQKTSLAVRKKVMVSLMYPCVLLVLVTILMVFLVTYVVPTFATLYSSMQAKLPAMTVALIAIGTTARAYIVAFAAVLVTGILFFRWWSRRESARGAIDRRRDLAQVPGSPTVAHFEHPADGRHPAGSGHGDRRRFARHAAAPGGHRARRQERARRPVSIHLPQSLEPVPRPGHRHDRGGRIHRRSAGHAEQRGGVL
jgi:type IV pilus assembly protein PilC